MPLAQPLDIQPELTPLTHCSTSRFHSLIYVSHQHPSLPGVLDILPTYLVYLLSSPLQCKLQEVRAVLLLCFLIPGTKWVLVKFAWSSRLLWSV